MSLSKLPWNWIALGLLAVGAFVAIRFLPLGEWMEAFNEWTSSLGWIGVLVFILAYAVGAVLFVPGSVMTIGAGLAFGLWKGVIVVSTGATLGAALAFLVARHIARGLVKSKAEGSEKFRAIDQAVGEQGWKLVGLLRLSPVVPYSLSNYFYGLTAVKFWPYVLASWIGMLPGTVLYVYLGAVGKAGLQAAAGEDAGRSPLEWVFLGAGLVVTIIVTVWVTKIARNALEKTEAKPSSKP